LPALVPHLNKTLNFFRLARAKNRWFFVLAIVVSGQQLHAIELMSSAEIMESRSWGITAYGKTEESEPTVKNGSTELEFEAEHEAAGVILTARPGDGLHYRLMYGVLRNYELEVGSSTFVNKHESQSNGRQYGVGARWNVLPVTAVSLGVAFDFAYVRHDVDFEKLTSNGVTSALDERFEQDEFQAAVNISKKWKQFEPYGGLKTSYVETRILDRTTQSKLYGNDVDWSPFVGLKWDFFQKESLLVEASFADEESVSAGLNIQF